MRTFVAITRPWGPHVERMIHHLIDNKSRVIQLVRIQRVRARKLAGLAINDIISSSRCNLTFCITSSIRVIVLRPWFYPLSLVGILVWFEQRNVLILRM